MSGATRRLAALLAPAAIAALAPGGAGAAPQRVPAVFRGEALWVREVSAGESGRELAARAAAAGVRTLYVKAGDGVRPEPQFTAALLTEIRSAGASVCAWTFAYGSEPAAEAAVAAGAVSNGAQCLVIDAEGEYDGLYRPAQLFVGDLRSRVGAGFPIGLASQAEVTQHPAFPYSVFLGPGGFNVVLPQIYWLDFGGGVEHAYSATMGANSIYGRPILPVGQLYNSPQPRELQQFRALAGAYASPGMSFFDLDVAQPQELAALASPLHPLPRRRVAAPTIHPGADGDEIVRAQELLNTAGAHLPVGGFYGAETTHAVASFQAHHHLPPTGLLTAGTWRALLRFTAREPSWADGPPASARLPAAGAP
jgi:Putative peptidoglycan binding domain